jgi:hypothetical protein
LSNKVSTGPGNIKSGERTTVSFPFADFHDDLDGALTLLVGSRFEVVNEASVVRLSP